jgi:hypothetical protein
MAKFKIKIDHKDIQKLKDQIQNVKKAVDAKTAKRAGVAAIEVMKDLISKGISPIRGKGRFPGYKNPNKYPGDRKAKRPVNLELTGEFLNSLEAKTVKGRFGEDTEVGYFNQESKDKEQGHREGHNGQLKRPTIPEGNEELAIKVERAVEEVYVERLEEVIRKDLK